MGYRTNGAEAVDTHLHGRCYDPATAQFLSRDPAVANTRSSYGYVAGNPLNATDPSGDCGLWGNDTCWGDAAGAIASGASHAAGAVATGASAAAGWVNNSVVQPVISFGNTHTFGICGTGSAGIGVGASGSGCFAFNLHSVGFTGTFGVGADIPGGADVGFGPLISDAHSVDELGGAFTYAGASLGEVFTANGEFGGGTLPCGRDVHYGWAGLGVGVSMPWPFPLSVWGGGSNTWTKSWSR